MKHLRQTSREGAKTVIRKINFRGYNFGIFSRTQMNVTKWKMTTILHNTSHRHTAVGRRVIGGPTATR